MTSHGTHKSAHLRRREVDTKKNLIFIRSYDDLLDKETTDNSHALTIEAIEKREKKA